MAGDRRVDIRRFGLLGFQVADSTKAAAVEGDLPDDAHQFSR
jgi:hypothetical protein